MLREEEFDRRLAALEQAVAEIQRRLAQIPDPQVGLDKLIGSISDVEAFEEALKYGREFRIEPENFLTFLHVFRL
jgi:hypothetical protein